MLVENLFTYPIKSTRPNNPSAVEVKFHGLIYDRNWAVFDADYKAITAREFPQLLEVSTRIERDQITVLHKKSEVTTSLYNQNSPEVAVKIFKESAIGFKMDRNVNSFFSELLGVDAQLIYMGKEYARPVSAEYGGKQGDKLSYADECPLLLLSNASLDDLNTRLENKISMQRFRPNITVDGCKAYEEDSWEKIRIGTCEFDVAQFCKRCVFTTIDPSTLERSPEQEPLRTLATYKKHPKGGVAFGIHLIPTKVGAINKGDEIIVIK